MSSAEERLPGAVSHQNGSVSVDQQRKTASLPLIAAATVLGLLLAVTYLRAEFQAVGGLGFPLDDSWIHMQFASSVASGNGLAYQDRLVTGSTAPLWTAVLSLLFMLPVPIVLTAKALGIVLLILAAIELARLCDELELPPALRWLALLLFLLTDWMLWSSVSGMEILLFVWLSLAACSRHLEEKRQPQEPTRSFVLFALAALARPEGLLLLLLAILDRLVLWPLTAGRASAGQLLRQLLPSRTVRLGLVSALLVVGSVLLVQFAIGGSPFPQTLRVKTDGVRQLWPSLRHVFQSFEILFRPQPFMALLAAGGALQLVSRLGTDRDRGLLPALWPLLLPLAFATMAAPGKPMMVGNFGRYLFPLFPFVIVLGVLALEPVLAACRRLLPSRAVRFAVLAVGAGLILWPSFGATLAGAERSARNVFDVQASDVAASHWIRDNLPSDAKLGVQDVGAVAFLTDNPLVDMAGIVTPEILPYVKGDLRGAHRSGLEGLVGFLRREQVDFLLLFPESYGGLETLRLLEPGLRPIYQQRLDGNITMAGSEIMILATPWGRYRPTGQPPLRDTSQ